MPLNWVGAGGFRARQASLVAGLVLVAALAEGGQTSGVFEPGPSLPAAEAANTPFAIEGPPPPSAPEVIARDARGRATIRAVRLTSPYRLDGRLDDAIYSEVPAISDFVQQVPVDGARATERTEAWVFFDEEHLYVSFRCWQDRPIVANEMRRDNAGIFQGDEVAFFVDPFYDRRNGVLLQINPLGGRMDGQVMNERQWNGNWNPVWEARVGRFDGGWTVEAAVPFKSLRYRPGRAQVWGFNARRVDRGRNELSYLTHVPAAAGDPGIMYASLAATLTGLEAPAGPRHLEIKPYAIADVRSDTRVAPAVTNDPGADLGLDVKYGLTQNLTADLTVNTDFAQVEADEQQVNLTRFSLFFPEKREFFLENQGTFVFGGSGGAGGGGGAGDAPSLFYSRRIGLHEGSVVPIRAGGRVTGRIGNYSLGALNIQAGRDAASGSPATNFTVLRLKRDLLRRSNIGVMYTRRSVGQAGGGASEAYGVDANFAFFENLYLTSYWAQTPTAREGGDDTSYRLLLDYAGDRYGVRAERLDIGDSFDPEVGFVRRDDMRKSFGEFRFSPRTRGHPMIRRYVATTSLAYIENGSGRVETRDAAGAFGVEFHSGDRFEAGYSYTYEWLPEPFPIGPGVTLPVGAYEFANVRGAFGFAQNRPAAANVSVEHGTFYSGTKTTVAISRGRVEITPQISLEPSFSVNRVDLAEGAFAARLVSSRVTYTMTPLMFVSALLQYNSVGGAVVANVRVRWEYRPGSELFVVFNEQRDRFESRPRGLANRAFIVKINRLLRF